MNNQEKVPPILIPVAPVHGGHAQRRAFTTTLFDFEFACQLWTGFTDRLSEWKPDWEIEVEKVASTYGFAERRSDQFTSDEDVFKALLLALLSNGRDWSTTEKIIGDLPDIFLGYDLKLFSSKSDEYIIDSIYKWFLDRKAASQYLKNDLVRLRDSAKKLTAWSARTGGSSFSYFEAALADCGGDLELLAVALGTSAQWKLPGYGVPLSAEILRYLGKDVCKPDRHILRAVGKWRLASFNHWPQEKLRGKPTASNQEYVNAMRAVRELAGAIGKNTFETDVAIWTGCAKSRAWLTNDELEKIAFSAAHKDT